MSDPRLDCARYLFATAVVLACVALLVYVCLLLT